MLNLPNIEDLIVTELHYNFLVVTELHYNFEDNYYSRFIVVSNTLNHNIGYIFKPEGFTYFDHLSKPWCIYTRIEPQDMETYKQFIRDLVKNDNFVNLFFGEKS